MFRCKYAGDASDEYCKDCDGLEMVVEGKTLSCSECAGYEPGTEEVGESEKNVENKEPMNPPEEEVKEEKKTSAAKTSKKDSESKDSEKENTSVNNKPSKEENFRAAQDNGVESSDNKIEGVVVTSIRYMSGCTVQKNDTYYKFTAEEEWAIDPMVINTPESVQEVREKLWAKVNSEVDKQVDDVLNL